MQNEFIANALLAFFPLFMIILIRMGIVYYRYASGNHMKNALHLLLALAFISSLFDAPRQAHAEPDPGTLVFYHTDHLGSTTAITDATGRVLQLLEYDPWGQVVKDIGDNYAHYRYTGQEYDPEIGLYNYKARLYAAGIGRFISADPIVSDPLDPQSLNRYSYVINNPLKYVDPSGYWTWKKFWQKFGGYVVGGVIIFATLVLTVVTGGAAAPLFIGAMLGGMIGYQVGGQWGFAIGAFVGALAGWAATGFSTFGLGGGAGAEAEPIQIASRQGTTRLILGGLPTETTESSSAAASAINWGKVGAFFSKAGPYIGGAVGLGGTAYGLSLLGGGAEGSSFSLLEPGMGFGYGVGYGTAAMGGYEMAALGGAGVGVGGAGGVGFTWPYHFLEERVAGAAGISIGMLFTWAGTLLVNAGIVGTYGILAGFVFGGTVTVLAGGGLFFLGVGFLYWGVYNTIYGLKGSQRMFERAE
jgi:RHS repeat-associated protein